MSTTQTSKKRHNEVVKSHSKRESAYKNSFGDFPRDTIYRDPLGFKTGGESVLMQKEWSEMLTEDVDWGATATGTRHASIIEKWNELQHKGFTVKQTTEEISKALGTGDFQLPLDIIQDVFVVQPEQTPAAEFITRVTTQDDRVHATPVTDQPEPSFDLETGAATDADGNRVYAFDDADYADLVYDVEGYGVATRITDKIILSSQNLRSPEATTEEQLLIGHRQKTERQIIWGTNAAAPSEGDSNGWGGFADYGERSLSALAEADASNPADVQDYVEDLIDECERAGAPLESIAVFLPFDLHRTLRRAFDERIRYEPAEALDVGFATFAMEGGQVPVFKTNAIPNTSAYPSAETNDVAFAVNMDSVALYQLQEPTIQPLAKLGPEERIAADQYNVLVSESGDGSTRTADHIQIGQLQTS
jgi:hypothetical protein